MSPPVHVKPAPAPVLLKHAIPIFVAAGLAASVGVLDAYFVGKLGLRELAAMGYALPVFFLMTSLATGFSNGVRATTAQAIGRNDAEGVRASAISAIVLSSILFGLLGFIAYLGEPLIVRQLGVPSDIEPHVVAYLRPLWFGMASVGVQISISSIFMGMGRATFAATLMLLAALLNAVFAPLLIFGLGPVPRLEVAGAAMATAGAWTVSGALGLVLSARGGYLRWPNLASLKREAASVLEIGVPYLITNAVWPAAIALMTVFVSDHGPEAVAAFGVGGRLAQLVRLGSVSLGAGIQIEVGQGFGRDDLPYVRSVVRAGRQLNYAWGLGNWALLAACSIVIAGALCDSESVAHWLQRYLWTFSASFGCIGASVMAACVLSAAGRPVWAATTNVTLAVLSLAGAWLGQAAGFEGILLGAVAGAVATDVTCSIILRRAKLEGGDPPNALEGGSEATASGPELPAT